MGRRTYPKCNASESWHDRVGHRGESFRSKRIDHLSLRRWRPVGARCREPAKNGLQKRSFHGRRLQRLESRGLADDEVKLSNAAAASIFNFGAAAFDNFTS